MGTDAIDTTRAAARATVWTLAGEHAADHTSDAAAPPPGRPAHRPRCRWLPAARQRWISGAEVAETTHAAFTGRRRGEQVTTRLIVRRVGPLNPAGADQGELLTAYRHHAVLTDSPMTLLQAETQHRGHAIIEQVIADLRTAPWPTYPRADSTQAARGWSARPSRSTSPAAAGALASTFHARAATATIRTQLIAVPARLARSAGPLSRHLPEQWPWEHSRR